MSGGMGAGGQPRKKERGKKEEALIVTMLLVVQQGIRLPIRASKELELKMEMELEMGSRRTWLLCSHSVSLSLLLLLPLCRSRCLCCCCLLFGAGNLQLPFCCCFFFYPFSTSFGCCARSSSSVFSLRGFWFLQLPLLLTQLAIFTGYPLNGILRYMIRTFTYLLRYMVLSISRVYNFKGFKLCFYHNIYIFAFNNVYQHILVSSVAITKC